jgi:hypothetical protein
MFPLTFQQAKNASVFAMAHSFTWNGARRETRVTDSTGNQVSAHHGIAIVQLVCFLTLLTTCSKYFRVVHSNHSQNEDQQPLCATTQLRVIAQFEEGTSVCM